MSVLYIRNTWFTPFQTTSYPIKTQINPRHNIVILFCYTIKPTNLLQPTP